MILSILQDDNNNEMKKHTSSPHVLRDHKVTEKQAKSTMNTTVSFCKLKFI